MEIQQEKASPSFIPPINSYRIEFLIQEPTYFRFIDPTWRAIGSSNIVTTTNMLSYNLSEKEWNKLCDAVDGVLVERQSAVHFMCWHSS
jgi:hypothetical protein